jgi:hypothetical protein
VASGAAGRGAPRRNWRRPHSQLDAPSRTAAGVPSNGRPSVHLADTTQTDDTRGNGRRGADTRYPPNLDGLAIVQHVMRVTQIRLICVLVDCVVPADVAVQRMAAGGLAGRVAADPAGGFSGWSL